MSALEIEQMIRSLPPGELREFAQWWDAHSQKLLAPSGGVALESEVVKSELLRRRQEYREQPERFERLDDDALHQMFRDIENEKP